MAEPAVSTATRQPKRRRSPAKATTHKRSGNGKGRSRRAAKASNLSHLEQLIRDLEARVS